MQSVKIDRLLRLGIAALAVVFIYAIYTAIHQRIVDKGDSAPEFTIAADTGQQVSVPSPQGNPRLLVLNFWASWCGPCVEETPSLSKFAQDYAPRGVEVLGISVDKDPAAYRNFLQKYRPAFLTARDQKIHEDYGTFMYPETYIIDAKGKVLLKIAEPADWTDPKLTGVIDAML
jgi:thiol-disulfide isomerase/thioredoxin